MQRNPNSAQLANSFGLARASSQDSSPNPARRRLLFAGLFGTASLLAAPLDALAAPSLHARHAAVADLKTGELIYTHKPFEVAPIASITKLMTALVVLSSPYQPLDETLTITSADVDRHKNSTSRLVVGSKLTRSQALHLALMSSENRAANALGRHYPGGMPAFVRAMNDQARALGMRNSHFVEPTGLFSENSASAMDLVLLLRATHRQSLIRRFSTDEDAQVTVARGRTLRYMNSNRLVRTDSWDISLSKTGYISEAGRCLAMVADVQGRSMVMVMLGAHSNNARIEDAKRLRQWASRHAMVADSGGGKAG